MEYKRYTSTEIREALKGRTLHMAVLLGSKIVYVKVLKNSLVPLPSLGKAYEAHITDDAMIIKAYSNLPCPECR